MFHMEQQATSPAFTPLSQRVPYTTHQIRHLFGRSDGKGKVIPIHPNTVARWRQRKQIPYFELNCRQFRYPRAAIDEILDAKREFDDFDV